MTFPHMNLMVGHSFRKDNSITKELSSVYSIDGKLVANVIPHKGDTKDVEAMTRLFAGSPDMYNALLDVVVWANQAINGLMGADVPEFAKRHVILNDLDGIKNCVARALYAVKEQHPAAKINGGAL